jgi:hypothetical protein
VFHHCGGMDLAPAGLDAVRIDIIVPVIAALLLIGFPMLRFGFDWVANANDDWANYNLRAIRFLNKGFYQEPLIGLDDQ